MKQHYFIEVGHSYVMARFCDFFTFKPSDLITTLTYVLMDNFCSGFINATDIFALSMLHYD